MTTGKITALTRWTFVGKVMSLLFNMLPGLGIVFLPRSKCFLISRLQSLSVVILEHRKIKVCHCFPYSPTVRSVVSDFLRPHGLWPARLLCPWRLSRQEHRRGLPHPPPGGLPDPGIEPRCLHCRWVLYCLSHQGSPGILEWGATPCPRGSSRLSP